MSGSGRPEASVDGSGLRIAVVTATWHGELCANLRSQALAALAASGAECVVDVRVPGALELPVVALAAARRADVDAVVTLGVVIRGGTPHFDYVCSATSASLADAALASGKPVANGVLTCDTLEQAENRDGRAGASESKGLEAACAAMATARVLKNL